jgi:hypothetical protein
LFLLGWVTPVVSIPLVLAIAYSLLRTIQNTARNQFGFVTDKKKLVVLLVILLIWVVLSGVSGLVWQNRWDHMYRNAIFHDLVAYDWPVINVENSTPRTLCYYLGFWLPSAVIGKVFGYQAGYLSLIIWAFFGIVLAFLLISEYLQKLSFKIVFLFIFFSGLDILPFLLYKVLSGSAATVLPELLHGAHLELTLFQFNASSNTTLLFWLYNQTIPFWVGFMLLLREKNNRSRLFIFMLLLLFAPFPSLALVPMVIYQCLRKNEDKPVSTLVQVKQFFKDTVTFENITGLLVSLIIALYFASNSAAGNLSIISLSKNTLVHFGLYLLIEFIVYFVFVFHYAKKDPIWWILFTTMILFSFVQMGKSYDFAWRTSIPASFYLMLLIMKWSNEYRAKASWKKLLFFAVIVFGFITPATEIIRTTQNTIACYTDNTEQSLVSDSMNSVFSNENDPFYANFIGKQDSIFTEYLQRK